MALVQTAVDGASGAAFPEAYWRVDYVLMRADAVNIFVRAYASEAARRAGLDPLPLPAREHVVRNWVEEVPDESSRVIKEAVVVDGVEVEPAVHRSRPLTRPVPHVDLDAFFGDALFLAGGATPRGQAYAYLKAHDGWRGATDA